ncbi:hypothetical protein GGS20DRAFT_534927, partial [Poronia punctata]
MHSPFPFPFHQAPDRQPKANCFFSALHRYYIQYRGIASQFMLLILHCFKPHLHVLFRLRCCGGFFFLLFLWKRLGVGGPRSRGVLVPARVVYRISYTRKISNLERTDEMNVPTFPCAVLCCAVSRLYLLGNLVRYEYVFFVIKGGMCMCMGTRKQGS